MSESETELLRGLDENARRVIADAETARQELSGFPGAGESLAPGYDAVIRAADGLRSALRGAAEPGDRA